MILSSLLESPVQRIGLTDPQSPDEVAIIIIIITRPKPAYGRQGLDWIVGQGYSFVVL